MERKIDNVTHEVSAGEPLLADKNFVLVDF